MEKIITSKKQLIEYLARNCRPEKSFKIGIEFEKLGVFYPSGKAIPYSGEKGVKEILKRLSKNFNWKPLIEEGNLVGLFRKNTRITLEPGGQLELSGDTLDNVHQIKEEVENHLKEIKYVSENLKIRWLGLGMQPVSEQNEIEWVPKKRYRIMAPYMKKSGKLGQDMMKKTASIQVNVDYSDEEDFGEKMKVALLLAPFAIAIFANSPISEGKLNGFLSKRAHIWNYTDPLRCGLIKRDFFSNPGFSQYVDYALEVPLLFIVRDKRWIKVQDINFLTYLKKGYQGYKPIFDDWELHLSTIFTEVRARGYIEIRSADSQQRELVLSVPAFWKGVMYSKKSREAVFSLMKGISHEKLCELYLNVSRKGLKTRLGKAFLLDFAREILKISYSGLKEQSKSKKEETLYLEPLMELVIESKVCPAEVIIKNWNGKWKRSIKKLVDYSSY